MPRTVLSVLLFACATPPVWAITNGQVDDFQGGAQLGWGGGSQELTVPADGGPEGAGDRYLAYSSFGSGGPNSRMVIPNEGDGNQWSGDYTSAGVAGIELDFLNSGDTAINLRLGIANASSWYVSSDPVVVPASSDWLSVAFMIAEEAMTRVGSGNDDFATVVSDVRRVRLFSSVGLPPVSFGGTGGVQGDFLAASIGFDNFRAIGVPEPASLLMIAAGLIIASQRRR